MLGGKRGAGDGTQGSLMQSLHASPLIHLPNPSVEILYLSPTAYEKKKSATSSAIFIHKMTNHLLDLLSKYFHLLNYFYNTVI